MLKNCAEIILKFRFFSTEEKFFEKKYNFYLLVQK